MRAELREGCCWRAVSARHFAMTLLILSWITPLLQASMGGCLFLCVSSVVESRAQNGVLYNLSNPLVVFAAIVGRCEWYLRALKSNQMTFFLLFKRVPGSVVKRGWKDRRSLWPSEANLWHVIYWLSEANAHLTHRWQHAVSITVGILQKLLPPKKLVGVLLDLFKNKDCELNHYSRQAVCQAPTTSKPLASGALLYCMLKCQSCCKSCRGWNALTDTVNMAAAFKSFSIVYVVSSLLYLLSPACCVPGICRDAVVALQGVVVYNHSTYYSGVICVN